MSVAVEYSTLVAWAAVRLGLAVNMRASTPDTHGAAIDVPLRYL